MLFYCSTPDDSHPKFGKSSLEEAPFFLQYFSQIVRVTPFRSSSAHTAGPTFVVPGSTFALPAVRTEIPCVVVCVRHDDNRPLAHPRFSFHRMPCRSAFRATDTAKLFSRRPLDVTTCCSYCLPRCVLGTLGRRARCLYGRVEVEGRRDRSLRLQRENKKHGPGACALSFVGSFLAILLRMNMIK